VTPCTTPPELRLSGLDDGEQLVEDGVGVRAPVVVPAVAVAGIDIGVVPVDHPSISRISRSSANSSGSSRPSSNTSSSTSPEGRTDSPAPVRSTVRAARTTRWDGWFRDQLPYRGSVTSVESVRGQLRSLDGGLAYRNRSPAYTGYRGFARP
jgi:hypothetical protein